MVDNASFVDVVVFTSIHVALRTLFCIRVMGCSFFCILYCVAACAGGPSYERYTSIYISHRHVLLGSSRKTILSMLRY